MKSEYTDHITIVIIFIIINGHYFTIMIVLSLSLKPILIVVIKSCFTVNGSVLPVLQLTILS